MNKIKNFPLKYSTFSWNQVYMHSFNLVRKWILQQTISYYEYENKNV